MSARVIWETKKLRVVHTATHKILERSAGVDALGYTIWTRAAIAASTAKNGPYIEINGLLSILHVPSIEVVLQDIVLALFEGDNKVNIELPDDTTAGR